MASIQCAHPYSGKVGHVLRSLLAEVSHDEANERFAQWYCCKL